jgi:HEAT repeat protein
LPERASFAGLIKDVEMPNKSDGVISLPLLARGAVLGLILVSFSRFVQAVHADDPAGDSIMFHDPEFTRASVVKTFPKGLTKLWLTALDRPEADLQSQAAVAIAAAHDRGMPELAVTAAALVRTLDRPDQHPAVRLASARALVVLDARDAGPSLLQHAEAGGAEFRELVEPAFARWDLKPMRAIWLDRLDQSSPHGRSLVLAIQGLAAVREEKAVPSLGKLALSLEEPSPYRLAAAKALGTLKTAGSESDAGKLTVDRTTRGTTSRLAAALLLSRHTGDEAVKLLQGLATDREPAAAVVALARLVEIDTKLVLPILPTVLASLDADVRAFGVEVLFKHPSEAHVRLLGERLADVHPVVRNKAREGLRQIASIPELRTAIIGQGMQALAAADWRGKEQAAFLLAQLGHKPAARGMVELLASDRPEVAVAGAWALRVLAVPDTLAAAHARMNFVRRQLLARNRAAGLRDLPPEAIDRQLSHLAQFIGQAKYAPAEDALRALVPRGGPPTPVGGESRAAAIWAIGLIHAGKPDVALAELIEGRLTGDPGMGPDDERVRRMAAVSLGRMQAKQSLPALQLRSAGTAPTLETVALACRWAVAQITGEPAPPPGTVEWLQQGWFLIPAPPLGR